MIMHTAMEIVFDFYFSPLKVNVLSEEVSAEVEQV